MHRTALPVMAENKPRLCERADPQQAPDNGQEVACPAALLVSTRQRVAW